MTRPPVYLDANASEPLRPEARQAAIAAMELTGNPASTHASGRASRAALERARGVIAHAFEVERDDVVLTSGATESCALAIAGYAGGRRVLVGGSEHEAVLGQAPDALRLPLHADGTLRLEELERALAGGPALVCVMAANNETGVLHPLAEIDAICARAGAHLHVDAAQGAGRLAIAGFSSPSVSIALSGHKLGGLKGAGALIRRGAPPSPLWRGGGQEGGLRAGTQGLPAILSMAAALEAARAEPASSVLRDEIEGRARAVGAIVAGADAPRLPHVSALVLPGVPARTQVIALDLAGFCVSAGAACASGRDGPSHVLEAMGFGAEASSGIRVSLPWNVAPEDASAFADAYVETAGRLRRRA